MKLVAMKTKLLNSLLLQVQWTAKSKDWRKVKKQQIKARVDFPSLSFKKAYAVQCMPKY